MDPLTVFPVKTPTGKIAGFLLADKIKVVDVNPSALSGKVIGVFSQTARGFLFGPRELHDPVVAILAFNVNLRVGASTAAA